MMAISWVSPDGSDHVDGMTTPGGYLGAVSFGLNLINKR